MPSKLEAILQQMQLAITKMNQHYEIVLNRLYLYYNMKLVTFGIDYQKNLIFQFSHICTTIHTYKISFVPS